MARNKRSRYRERGECAGRCQAHTDGASETIFGYVTFCTIRCHLLHKAVVSASFSPDLSGLSESFICQKRRSISCETYLADRNRHSIPSRSLSALSLRLGGAPPTIHLIISMLNHLNANACRNTVSLPHHHCTS
jgi:hypothetical protein